MCVRVRTNKTYKQFDHCGFLSEVAAGRYGPHLWTGSSDF